MIDKEQLQPGMVVYTSDGEKVGKISRVTLTELEVEKGFLFKDNFMVSYQDISEIRDDRVVLAQGRESLLGSNASRVGAMGGLKEFLTGEKSDMGSAHPDSLRSNETGLRSEQNVSMPLAEEELEVEKTRRSAGTARLRKEVHTEMRTINVPVTHEEAILERVPASERRAAGEIGNDEISIPLTEEEIEVRKRPVVREEVRLRKERTQQDRQITEPVRKETAELTVEGNRKGTLENDDWEGR